MWTHGGVHTPLSTYVSESVVAGSINHFPSLDAIDTAAFSLALTGTVEPVDLVATGQLTKEEWNVSVSGLTYKVSAAALDALPRILAERDTALGSGASTTTQVHWLVVQEEVRRRGQSLCSPGRSYRGSPGNGAHAVYVPKLLQCDEAIDVVQRIATNFLQTTASGECAAPMRTTKHMRKIQQEVDADAAQQYSYTMNTLSDERI